MTDHIISPDGKFMWTGSEWIPAPPSGKSASQNYDITNTEIVGQLSQSSEGGDNNNNQKINLQDVNAHKGVKQTAISEGSSSQELKVSDTVIMGDLTQNTTINSIEDTKIALKEMFDQAIEDLRKMGFDGDSSPAELTPSQEAEVEQVLEMSEQLTSHSIEIDPWTEVTLGNAAHLAGKTHAAQQHYLRALVSNGGNGDGELESKAKHGLGNIALLQGRLDDAYQLYQESFLCFSEINIGQVIANLVNLSNVHHSMGDYDKAASFLQEAQAANRKLGDRYLEGAILHNMGRVAEWRDDLDEAKRLYLDSLAVKREIGDRMNEVSSLNGIGSVTCQQGHLDESEQFYLEGLAINSKENSCRESEYIAKWGLGIIEEQRGNLDNAHRYYFEVVQILKEMNIPVMQDLKDKGY